MVVMSLVMKLMRAWHSLKLWLELLLGLLLEMLMELLLEMVLEPELLLQEQLVFLRWFSFQLASLQ